MTLTPCARERCIELVDLDLVIAELEDKRKLAQERVLGVSGLFSEQKVIRTLHKGGVAVLALNSGEIRTSILSLDT